MFTVVTKVSEWGQPHTPEEKDRHSPPGWKVHVLRLDVGDGSGLAKQRYSSPERGQFFPLARQSEIRPNFDKNKVRPDFSPEKTKPSLIRGGHVCG